TAVRHVIDRRQGFVSELETSPPPGREGPRSTVATLGVVSRVDDPDGMGRVRVVLPNYNDVEAGWYPVVTPGAGLNKGIVALPDIDDRVLVVLLEGDPARGVVIGGLYGESPPPDSGVEEGAVRRYTLATPGGLRVRLDDGAGTVAVENGAGDRISLTPEAVLVTDSRGSRIELSAEKCRILSMADLEISAPGKKVTIGGQNIGFERV
ncbi:phage baseplate assembly protein V, partial [Desulfococcus sp.]|uniref:phage baseplate assembly protein V n=1 Tax=Desulfococcus sp. TaxID=2025834 RepID=UPI00359336B8